MEDSFSKLEIKEVKQTAVAKLLIDNKKLKYFIPFIKKEQTIKSAAKELRLSQSTTLYHVKKFLKLGILKIVRKEKRAGRAIKFYKSSSESYFIHFSLTDAESFESILLAEESNTIKHFNKAWIKASKQSSADWGIYLFKNKAGQIATAYSDKKIVFDSENPFKEISNKNQAAIFATWSLLSLDYQKAKELQTELLNLYQTYQEYSNETGEQQYLVHLAMTPIGKS